jgi:hypothetical protein
MGGLITRDESNFVRSGTGSMEDPQVVDARSLFSPTGRQRRNQPTYNPAHGTVRTQASSSVVTYAPGFTQESLVTPEELEQGLDTCDLIFWEGNAFSSFMVKLGTGCRFSHVALVEKVQATTETGVPVTDTFLWECVSKEDACVCVLDQRKKKGVRLVRLREKLVTYGVKHEETRREADSFDHVLSESERAERDDGLCCCGPGQGPSLETVMAYIPRTPYNAVNARMKGSFRVITVGVMKCHLQDYNRAMPVIKKRLSKFQQDERNKDYTGVKEIAQTTISEISGVANGSAFCTEHCSSLVARTLQYLGLLRTERPFTCTPDTFCRPETMDYNSKIVTMGPHVYLYNVVIDTSTINNNG